MIHWSDDHPWSGPIENLFEVDKEGAILRKIHHFLMPLPMRNMPLNC